jgi:uncharacterized protein (DUF1499 family)
LTRKRWKTLMWLLTVLGVLVAGALLCLVWLVDDWGRDLSTNWATTDAEAGDALLRPLRLAAPADEVVAAIRDWVDTQSHWAVVDQQPTGDVTVLHLVRTTRLMRYRDDITVRVQKLEGGDETLVTAESRSRVGRGDFGQNPRNLKEILGSLRQALE